MAQKDVYGVSIITSETIVRSIFMHTRMSSHAFSWTHLELHSVVFLQAQKLKKNFGF